MGDRNWKFLNHFQSSCQGLKIKNYYLLIIVEFLEKLERRLVRLIFIIKIGFPASGVAVTVINAVHFCFAPAIFLLEYFSFSQR